MIQHTAIIAGAGITGLSAAIWLQRQGWSVTLVDPLPPGDPGQASFGNAGLLARCAVVPVSVPGLWRTAPAMLLDPDGPLFLKWRYLARIVPWLLPFLRNGRADRLPGIVAAIAALTADSVDQHMAMAVGTGAERLIRTGDYAYLYRSDAALAKDCFGMDLRRAHGLDWKRIGRDELADRDPALNPAFTCAAVFPGHGWITDPGAYAATLARHLSAKGATLLTARVAAIRPGDPACVILDTGETLCAARVILAQGIWSRGLAETLGLHVPLESERGYHLMLHGPSALPPHPYMVAEAKMAVTPMAGGLRLAGTVEYGGTALPPSEAPVRLLRRRASLVYPGLQWASETRWMGHRPSLPDSLPMLGDIPGAPGVIAAFGSQHLGLTIAPRLGRLVADIAAGLRGNTDLRPYDPARFGRANRH
jgi:D-amino-acid dehydrogenase